MSMPMSTGNFKKMAAVEEDEQVEWEDGTPSWIDETMSRAEDEDDVGSSRARGRQRMCKRKRRHVHSDSDSDRKAKRVAKALLAPRELRFHAWARLPSDMAQYIMSFLDIRDKLTLQRCDKTTRALARSPRVWTQLDLSELNVRLTTVTLLKFRHVRPVHLRLSVDCEVALQLQLLLADDDKDNVCNPSPSAAVVATSTTPTAGGDTNKRFLHVLDASAAQYRFRDEHLAQLARIACAKRLKSLDLSFTNVSDEGMTYLKDLALERLDTTQTPHLTDAGLARIDKSDMHTLGVSAHLTAAGICSTRFTPVPQLRLLRIQAAQSPYEFLVMAHAIYSSPAVSKLTFASSTTESSARFRFLFPGVNSIVLIAKTVSTSGTSTEGFLSDWLRVLAGCPQVTRLDLSTFRTLDDAALKLLRQTPLQQLAVSRAVITAGAIGHLLTLQRLEVLHIPRTFSREHLERSRSLVYSLLHDNMSLKYIQHCERGCCTELSMRAPRGPCFCAVDSACDFFSHHS